jgi:hypothetical protein
MDGRVNIWEMKKPSKNMAQNIIEKIFEYPLSGDLEPDQAL